MRPIGRTDDPEWAWAAYVPNEQRPWDLVRVGHLYRRAGFGASWNQLQAALEEGPGKAVDRLIAPKGKVGSFTRTFDEYENSAGDSEDMARAWWLRRMLETPHPLLEKLTVLWHSHFGLSSINVGNLGLLTRYVQTLRSHALGDYRELVFAVSRNPATYLALGASHNRKADPNTSFTRQLMEQYTLGPKLTTETDVQEAARAFTGWFVRRDRLHFVEREHDPGTKVFLGCSGSWTDRDILNIVLGHPEVPRLIVRKLYRWFISEIAPPPDFLVAPLAGSFGKDFNVAKLLQTMFRSNLFFSEQAYRSRVKSPVEYALGIVLAMEGRVPTLQLGQDIKKLGQDLYNPPTRIGWVGGRRWLNPPTLIGRANLAADLLSPVGSYGGKLDPAITLRKSGSLGLKANEGRILDILLQGNFDRSPRIRLAGSGGSESRRLCRLIQGVLMLPEYQLA